MFRVLSLLPVTVLLSVTLWTVPAVGSEEPNITFSITNAEGRRGQEVEIKVLITTDTDLQGWSWGVRWNPDELELIEAREGAVLQTVNNGNPADFIDLNDNPENGPGVTEGVVVSFPQLAVLSPGSDYEVAILRFLISAEAEGDPIESEISFADDLGSPPVAVVAVVAGQSIVPTLVSGIVTIQPPPEDCRIVDFVCESDPDNAYLSWGYLACDKERPFEFLILYREHEVEGELVRERLAVWDIEDPELTELPTHYDDLGLAPGIYRYTLAWVYWPASGDPITISSVTCETEIIALLISDIQPRSAFLTGLVRNELGELVPGELVITGRGFTTVEDTTLTIGDLPVEVIEVIEDNTIRAKIPCSPALGTFDLHLANSRGEVTVPEAFSYGWLRGDVRIDGVLDLQDAIDILSFLFKIPGWVPLVCLDAADVNDDGYLDIADAIFLTYMIAGRDPLAYTPPEPFKEPSAEDPTPDDLDCSLEGFSCP